MNRKGFGLIEVTIAAAIAGGLTLFMAAILKDLLSGGALVTRRGEKDRIRQWLANRVSCEKSLEGNTPSGLVTECHSGQGNFLLKDKNGESLPNKFGNFELQVSCPKPAETSASCGCSCAGCLPCATQIQVEVRPFLTPEQQQKVIAAGFPLPSFENLFQRVPFPCEGTRSLAETTTTPTPTPSPATGVMKVLSQREVTLLQCQGALADAILGYPNFFASDLCAGEYVQDIYFSSVFGEEFTDPPHILVSVSYGSYTSGQGCIGQTVDRVVAR